MRSLFLKIFVWFWIVQLLIGAAMYGVLSMAQPDSNNARLRGFVSDMLTGRARDAADAYSQGGVSTLTSALQRHHGPHDPLAAYSAQGVLLAGQGSPQAHALALKAARQDTAQWDLDHGHNLAACRATSGGHTIVLVQQLRPPHNGALDQALLPLHNGPLPMLVLLAISCAVCYGLASYLAAPATKLRQATRRLAGGDLSTRVAAQMGRRRDELADMGHDFDAMAERIEGLMLSERRLLGDISHELRSPLARLNVALDLAAQGADADTNSYLERIRRESERLNEMIGQLLALTRLESGEAHALRAPLDLAALVREVAADAAFEAQSRGGRVEVSTTPCILDGNNALLRSAVENIVRNALRYTSRGTAVEIVLQCGVHSGGKGGASGDGRSAGGKVGRQAMITVRDHGPGVPSESLEKIFRPFFRVADARDRQSGGTGLGLAIALRAVRYHGGDISASNAQDGGLLVQITLPAGDGTSRARPAAIAAGAPAAGTGPTDAAAGAPS